MGSNATSFVGRAFQRHADALGVAFVGVSGTIPRGPHSFVWAQDSERNAARIAAALAEVADRLTVKQGAVVAFGFSQGAQAAAEVAVRYPEKYAGAIVLSPGGLEDPKPSAFQPSPAHREQGYVVACGARELPGNVFLTSEYARLTGGMGARVRHKTYPGVSAHTFPPDFDKVLPEWIRFILGPKQS